MQGASVLCRLIRPDSSATRCAEMNGPSRRWHPVRVDDGADGRYARLVDILTDAAGLLDAAGEPHWARRIRQSRAEIAAGDAYGLEHLLGAYGGMGSLNDLYLGPDEERLQQLLQEAWVLATDLRHELGDPNRLPGSNSPSASCPQHAM
jgi:hypothetical protein